MTAKIYVRWLENRLISSSPNSDYTKCLDDLKKQVEWNGWEERYLVNILKKHFA